MMVVVYHLTQLAERHLHGPSEWLFGSGGVDLFFSISGFVMVLTTHQHWGKADAATNFLWRRIVRIVPLYWITTAFKLCGLLLLPALAPPGGIDPWHAVASFLFIPAWDAWHRAQPLVPVGWTLNYEMFFYLIFALALWRRVHPVLWVGLGLAVFSALPLTATIGAVGTLAGPILLEFVAGMLIGWATLKGRQLPVVLAWPLLIGAFVAFGLTQTMSPAHVYTWRPVVWGIPGAVAVASAVALEPFLQRWVAGWPKRLGDASYALYLSHTLVLPPLGMLLVRLSARVEFAPMVAVAASALLCAAVGLAVHRWIEAPLTARLQLQRSARLAIGRASVVEARR